MSRRRLYLAVGILPFLLTGAVAPSWAGGDLRSIRRAEDHVRAAQREIERGDLQGAHRRIVKALQHEPSFPAAHLLLGHIDMRAGRFEGALEHYQRARDGHAEVAERLRQLQAERFARARQRVAQLRDALRAAEMYGQRVRGIDRSRAENEIRRLQSLKPPSSAQTTEVPAEILFHLGNARFRLGQLDDARAAWERCCERRPNFPLPFYNLGLLHARIGNPYLALWHLDRAEELGFEGNPELREALEARLQTSPRL
jgi:tetratricopeptide (TPR) repeat protein